MTLGAFGTHRIALATADTERIEAHNGEKRRLFPTSNKICFRSGDRRAFMWNVKEWEKESWPGENSIFSCWEAGKKNSI